MAGTRNRLPSSRLCRILTDDNDGSECGRELRRAERLDEEQENQDAACRSYDGRLLDIRRNNAQTLNSSKNGLCGGQYTVRKDHGSRSCKLQCPRM